MEQLEKWGAERILKEIQSICGIDYAIQPDVNLLTIGMYSLQIMRFGSVLKKNGIKVSFLELVENPTIQNWEQLISERINNSSSEAAILQVAASEEEEETIGNAPFDLTDVQYSYLIGREEDQSLGGVGCHAYMEFDGSIIDTARLQKAWSQLFVVHPMLRARFTEDGKQQIMDKPYSDDVKVFDLRSCTEDEILIKLLETRENLQQRKLKVEEGQVIDLSISLLPDGKSRLHFDLDLLVCDAKSIGIILRDLTECYTNNTVLKVNKNWSFEKYLQREKKLKAEDREKDKLYWKEKMEDMALRPNLPLKNNPAGLRGQTYVRNQLIIKRDQWTRLQQLSSEYQVTPSMVLLTIYADVLSRWSNQEKFLLNLPLFNRNLDGDEQDTVIADFTSIMLFEARCDRNLSFVEKVRALSDEFYQDISHSAYSGVELLRELAIKYPGERDFAPIVFSCTLGRDLVSDERINAIGELNYMISQTPQVWIDCQVFEMAGRLMVSWDTVQELFPDNMINQMFASFEHYINCLTSRKEIWEQDVDFLANEIKVALNERTKFLLPEPTKTLIDEFCDNVNKMPDKIALVEGVSGKEITYSELYQASIKISALLKKNGVAAGDKVAFTLARGVEQIQVALGILLAGACYVPISVSQPDERRRTVHSRMNIMHVITNKKTLEEVAFPENVKVVCVEDAEDCEEEKRAIYSPCETAYIILTSGSTGEPKGVEVTHYSAWNTIEDINNRYDVTDRDVLLAVSAMDFDLSVYDVFGALSAGATLVVLSEETRKDVAFWLEMIDKYGVTIWNSVPILLKMLLTFADGKGIKINSLRQVMLSGDWIGLDLPEKLNRISSNCKLVAMGGATEASIWSNYYDVELPIPTEWNSIPYGFGLENQVYLVMNSKGEPCPDWVPGELWIGGAGVAKGYCGDEELTKSKFVEYNGERWYRTGDMGRFWSDGTIEFLGRTDFQVKIRGHRIELGEIEVALKKCNFVKDALVVAVGERNEQFLAAYIVMDGEQKFDAENFIQQLEGLIPEYMIPTAFVEMNEIPITANGKVDRKNLPKPNLMQRQYIAPDTKAEKTLALIWSELFEEKEISVNDNYFRLGGDSLIGVRMINEIREKFNIEVSLSAIFKRPVLRMLATYIESRKEEAKPLPQLIVDKEKWSEPFPLSDIQYAYWIGQQSSFALGGTSTHCYMEIDGTDIEVERLNVSWNKLIQCQSMMRAVILPDGTQKVLREVPEYHIEEYDFSELSQENKQQQLDEIRKNMSEESTNPEEWPLFRVCHSKLGNGKDRIHISFDNIIFDGWSVFYAIQEWTKCYKNLDYIPLCPEISYRDYVMSLERMKEEEKYVEDKTYWTERIKELAPSPELPLITSPDMLKNQTYLHLKRELDKTKWEQIKVKAKNMQVTPSCVLLTAYAQTLARWSRKSEFTINLTQFNRLFSHPQINDIIGDFTTPIMLSVDLKKDTSFIKRASRIQTQLLSDMEHPFFSGVEVQRELSRYTDGQQKNIPIVFTSTIGLGALSESELLGELTYTATQTPQVWLDLQVHESNGALSIGYEAVEELFEVGVPNAILEAFYQTLVKLSESEDLWKEDNVSVVPVTLPQEYRPVADLLSGKTIDEMFVEQVRKNGNRSAVINGDKELTYKELYQYASLIAKDVAPHTNVAIIMDKGWEQIVATMSVLLAGATYLPIDPENPEERKKIIIDNSLPTLILTQSWLYEDTIKIANDIPVLEVDKIEPVSVDTSMYKKISCDDQPAYIIFTSGSTGEPKGVVISHQSVLNTIIDVNNRFGITETDRTIGLSNLNFDLSVYDIFGMLCFGGAIVLPSAKERKNPKEWLDIIINNEVTVWNTVPAFMQMFVEYLASRDIHISPLKCIMMSGDWIPISLINQIREVCSDEQTIISLGGATEAAIWSNYYIVDKVEDNWKSIPYGYPLTNQYFRILNEQLEDCPAYVPGKLYIGGKGLALEYFNDEQKTAEKFIVHPLTGERLYDTGDLGCYWDDGTMEFLGRDDFQVKIRGHRIELGEIESVLRNSCSVSDAIVVALEGERHEKTLVAYVVPCNKDDFELETFKEEIKEQLTEYMFPNHFVQLDAIPLTPNGKVKRNDLPQPVINDVQFVELITETEKKLAKIWAELFDVGSISRTDNYFTLGGDSLLAIRTSNRINEMMKIDIPLGKIFEFPVLKDFANYIDSHIIECTQKPDLIVDSENWNEPFDLSDIQYAYWIGSNNSMSLGGTSTHCYFELDCGVLDNLKLERAINRLVQEQGMMRAVILPEGKQRVLESVSEYHIETIDLVEKTSDDKKIYLEKIKNDMSFESTDCTQWPLFKIVRSVISPEKQRLHMSFDNIMYDGWSVFYIIEQLAKYYFDSDVQEEPLKISYRDYIVSLNHMKQSERYEEDKLYWQERIKKLAPIPELPLKVEPETVKNPTFIHLKQEIEMSKWIKIKEYAKNFGITPSCVLITAYAQVLARWSKKAQFTINLTQFNRLFNHEQINDVVGDFTTPIMLSVDMEDSLSFADRALRIQKQLFEDMEHPYYSGVEVQRELAKMNTGIQKNIPIIFTSTLGFGMNQGKNLGELNYTATQTPQIWLDFQAIERNGNLYMSLEAVKELFEETIPEQMIEAYKTMLDILSEEVQNWQEESKSLVRFELPRNRESAPVEMRDVTIDELFVEQVLLKRDKIAVITEQKDLTYGELFDFAMAVSNHIQPKEIVAVIMEKGWEQIVAVMGILLAGATYLPIDPENPLERRKRILNDAKVNVILTQSEILEQQIKCAEGRSVIAVDQLKPAALMDYKKKANSTDTAYIIYTSGSTGLPKGVVISHEGALNTIADINKRFGLGDDDKTIALSNLNFDLSVYDIFGMLCYGGAIVIPEQSQRRNPEHWIQLVKKYKVTVWNTVPAFVQMLTDYAETKNISLKGTLKTVLMSGDWISVNLPEKINNLIGDGVNIISLGGATEASIWSNYYVIDKVEEQWKSIPYGYPLTNQYFRILNDRYEDCPSYVPGRLFIGGVGLAKGYFNDEVKTNEKFIIHPSTKEQLYDTGDLGCYWPDGTMEFLGRDDFQVKIRGHRIELGEIEYALKSCKGVEESITIVNKNKNGKIELSSFITVDNVEETEFYELRCMDTAMNVVYEKVSEAWAKSSCCVTDALPRENLNYYKNMTEKISKNIFCRVLTQLNLFEYNNGICKKAELTSKYGISSKYVYLLEQWLNVFLQDGSIAECVDGFKKETFGEELYGVSFDEGYKEINVVLQELWSYMEKAIPTYLDLFLGLVSYYDILTKDIPFLTPNRMMNYILPAKELKKVFASNMEVLLSELPVECKGTILEIGSRASTNYKECARLADKYNSRYIYTDESMVLLDKIAAELQDNNLSVDKVIYSLTEEPQFSGIEDYSIDVIVCDNALHRNVDLDKAIYNIKKMLAPGGSLIITESTQNGKLMLASTAFFENGFSDYLDERKGMPLLSRAQWVRLLTKHGFSVCSVYPSTDDDWFGQYMFMAKAPESVHAFKKDILVTSLKDTLPEYMIPTYCSVLKEMPLTSNGKVDRKYLTMLTSKLSALLSTKQTSKENVKWTDTQTNVANAWCKVLHCDSVDLDSDFFENGGDSLVMVQLINALLEDYDYKVSMGCIFSGPTVEEIATAIDNGTAEEE